MVKNMLKNKSQKDKGTYVLPEVIPFALCGSVLVIVLEQNEKARILFEQIKENCKLPGCQEAFAKFEKDIPKGNKLIRNVVKSAGYNYKKPPSIEENKVAYGKGLFFGAKNLIIRYTRKFTPWAKSNRHIPYVPLVSCESRVRRFAGC
jgi:hypothetical protein